uniref:Uncharacterized protein n=1 Tax=Ditylenchus dipsaci TaxID=166011 RepID=A0A915DVV0_9BILA
MTKSSSTKTSSRWACLQRAPYSRPRYFMQLLNNLAHLLTLLACLPTLLGHLLTLLACPPTLLEHIPTLLEYRLTLLLPLPDFMAIFLLSTQIYRQKNHTQ